MYDPQKSYIFYNYSTANGSLNLEPSNLVNHVFRLDRYGFSRFGIWALSECQRTPRTLENGTPPPRPEKISIGGGGSSVGPSLRLSPMSWVAQARKLGQKWTEEGPDIL